MTRHHSAFRTIRLAFAASLLLAAPAFAQEAALALEATPIAPVAVPDSTPSAPAASVGPTLEGSRVAAKHQPAEAPTALAAARGGYGQPFALMVVGGAAVLTGLIIGGDAGHAIAFGGAVVGLIGLYQYLQ